MGFATLATTIPRISSFSTFAPMGERAFVYQRVFLTWGADFVPSFWILFPALISIRLGKDLAASLRAAQSGANKIKAQ